jgi:hypothetical protein
MSMNDATAFNLSLANAALFYDQRTRTSTFKYENSVECLTYYGKCLREISKRLGSSDDSVSDGVIMTVLGLLCHDVRAVTNPGNLFLSTNIQAERCTLVRGIVGTII